MFHGILFSSVRIEITGYEKNPGDVNYLWGPYAEKARRYIMGLAKSKREGVDLTKLNLDEIKDKLEAIGSEEASI